MTLVFQYGSNVSTGRLNSQDRLQGDANPIGTAYTEEEFQLVFDIWSNCNGCAAADIVLGNGRNIWGVVYDIPDNLIYRGASGKYKSLDEIEGESSNYERVAIRLKWPDGTTIEEKVLTYIGKRRQSGIMTSIEYSQHIILGLKGHSVPAEYIDYVKEQVIRNNAGLESHVRGL